MTGLLRHRTFLRRRELKPSYDVVIVGGGVNGLSLAHNLAAHHGITDVAVLEANYIGSGGSGRNTQVVRANYNTPETVPLYKASLAIWRTLSAELDFNLLFSTQGELDLCHTHDSLEVERDKSLLNRAYGVQTDVLTPDEIAAMNPLVDLTGGGELPIVGASFHPPGSFARHDAVVWGY
jgi:sarcosine oxidase subunit beta